jgi:ribosomal-protein-serine acetyltransferase
MFSRDLSDGITLRLLQARHARELFMVIELNRQHLRQWLPWLDATTSEADVAAFIHAKLLSFAQTGAFVCGIWQGGVLRGVIGHNQIDWDSRTAHLGYWLAKNAEARGLMTASCRAYLEHAFGEYALNRVIIHVATGNTKSQGIPSRLGFHKDGVLRQAEWLYDRYVDQTVNSLLRSEYEAGKSASV